MANCRTRQTHLTREANLSSVGDVVMHRGKVDVKRIVRPTPCQSVFLENCRGNLFSLAQPTRRVRLASTTDKRFSRMEKGTARGQSQQFVSLNVNSRIYWQQKGSRRRKLFYCTTTLLIPSTGRNIFLYPFFFLPLFFHDKAFTIIEEIDCFHGAIEIIRTK